MHVIGVFGGGSGSAKPPPPTIKPKLQLFAKGTKKDVTKESAHGMVIDGILSIAAADVPSKVVKRLGGSGASCHNCSDISLLWHVRVREDTVVMRHLSRVLKICTIVIVKLECREKESGPVLV